MRKVIESLCAEHGWPKFSSLGENVFAAVVELTPPVAEALWERHRDWQVELINNDIREQRNRQVRGSNLSRLVDDISNDHWYLNGQPIIFDKDGHLCDGQHRVRACIVAEKPIHTLIVFVPVSVMVLDQCQPRSLTDWLRIFGSNLSAKQGAIAKTAELFPRTDKVSFDRTINLCSVWEPHIDFVVDACSPRVSGVTTTLNLAALCRVHRHYAESKQHRIRTLALRQFCEVICSPETAQKGCNIPVGVGIHLRENKYPGHDGRLISWAILCENARLFCEGNRRKTCWLPGRKQDSWEIRLREAKKWHETSPFVLTKKQRVHIPQVA